MEAADSGDRRVKSVMVRRPTTDGILAILACDAPSSGFIGFADHPSPYSTRCRGEPICCPGPKRIGTGCRASRGVLGRLVRPIARMQCCLRRSYLFCWKQQGVGGEG
jgi:hypothetical protein